MNLHYSQTLCNILCPIICLIPLWIYITLKRDVVNHHESEVLYLYEFTLLSNGIVTVTFFTLSYTSMNLHYSQTTSTVSAAWFSLIPLWIYITLKPCFRGSVFFLCLIPLWIYITLKRAGRQIDVVWRLIPLWIYITLKHARNSKSKPCCLIPLWIYITLKRLSIP